MATKSNSEITGWVGWLGFASFMLLFAGFFHIIEGVAFRARQALFIHSSGYVWVLNYNKWGWIEIIGGILMIVAGLSLIKGGMFGRVFACLVAILSMLVAVSTLPSYPLWSIIVLVVDALVIYAVTVHGSEAKRIA